jgi:hypothetical protein
MTSTQANANRVAGAGAALVVTSGQIVLADITTPARRGRVMAIYQGASSSAGFRGKCAPHGPAYLLDLSV